MQRRKLQIVFLLAAVTVTAVTVFMSISAISLRRASGLRDEVCDLKIGQSTFSDVNQLANKYGAHATHSPEVEAECSQSNCSFVFAIKNWPLGKLPFAPKMGFIATLRISDNSLSSRYIALVSGCSGRYMEVFVEQRSDLDLPSGFRIVRRGSLPQVGIQLPPNESPEFTRLAKNLSFKSFVSPTGCTGEPTDMLPFLRDKMSQVVNQR
jgi:hypothetical protein